MSSLDPNMTELHGLYNSHYLYTLTIHGSLSTALLYVIATDSIALIRLHVHCAFYNWSTVYTYTHTYVSHSHL